MKKVNVIGAGLAGCEVAWIIANNGIKVKLYDMKPKKFTPVHSYGGFCELVCSNSLKALRIESSGGLLKEEMRLLGSVVVDTAYKCKVSAGGALAVDREKFSDIITQKISSHENIEIVSEEVLDICDFGDNYLVIATGPLTSGGLFESIKKITGKEHLNFYDAASPIISFDSIDSEKTFFASRYDRGEADYINCPMDEVEYKNFYNELINAEVAPLKEVDKETFRVYEGCMPVEVMAKRGLDTLRFGPLKPVGIRDPKTSKRPWAVVQLRKENNLGSLYNMVGFQTNLKFAEQKRVFSMIPGLETAEYVRYGVMHRNTFIDSPRILDDNFCFKAKPNLFFAGQITGVEGYIESAASGIAVGYHILRRISGKSKVSFPETTLVGALSRYISDQTVVNFQPMGSNMGILPGLEVKMKDKKERYIELANRSITALKNFINLNN